MNSASTPPPWPRSASSSTPTSTSGARPSSSAPAASQGLEHVLGVVETITYHNPETGWTVLKVAPFKEPGRMVPVVIHQVKVFAGATMEFWGNYGRHPKYGEQFKAVRALEKKPATAAALEKYLGSGLIKGVGPVIAKRIVQHFGPKTLEIFEDNIEALKSVPGIADKKLEAITTSWEEHRAIRDVMIFLQEYGISTLFATKIFKTYGPRAIEVVSKNPYRLAEDIYGIGFFSADRIALAMGFERDGDLRLGAGIRHTLAASRDEGHCFLTEEQIHENIPELLREAIAREKIGAILSELLLRDRIKSRVLHRDGKKATCFYARGLYYDEVETATCVARMVNAQVPVESARIRAWVERYCAREGIALSDEQLDAVCLIPAKSFSILTGGPGCGKTTTTRVLIALLSAMQKVTLLAAPTGRAAQRMTEVIGVEAKTIHRLLEWQPGQGGFKRSEDNPLECDFLVVDEVSMLDISLAASLLKAVPGAAQVLFIGDPDQLPAVGAGDVLADLLRTQAIPRFRLTKVFRQAAASSIVRFAHEINTGSVPRILSPLAQPSAFQDGHDCLFLDADEATQAQLQFLQRARTAIATTQDEDGASTLLKREEAWMGRLVNVDGEIAVDRLYRPEVVDAASLRAPVLTIPEKFEHVDLARLAQAQSEIEEIREILKSVHPWSSIHYGLTAVDTVVRLYTQTIPKWFGGDRNACEIQVLTPQVRGTLGTLNLNEVLQRVWNPPSDAKASITLGERIFRVQDRVIQTRNNYDLGVFNGDIGHITRIDPSEGAVEVTFSGPEARTVIFERDVLSELALAYAITIHKSQGSEFPAVIVPVLGQHHNMLFRNLIYTALTRAKKLAVFVGSRRAFALAIRQADSRKRQTALSDLLQAGAPAV